ncbi:MAG TPA: hypothetical protein VGR67_14710 [Candidatus Polarisedimenticolia bacterium]|nr:hypothetical protein [Candidatus Polarisedimenticolia bacterium]
MSVSRMLRLLSRGLTAAAILGLGMAAGSARAQTQAAPPAGSVPVSPNESDLTVSAGERYSSNPRFQPDGESAEADTITDLRLDLSMRRHSARSLWSFRYNPSYTKYHDNDQLDTSNHALDFKGAYDASRRWKILLGERFAYRRDALYSSGSGDAADVTVLSQSKRWRSFTDVAADAELSRSLVLQTGLNARVDRFQDETLVDSETYSGRLGLRKQLNRDQSISATYLHSRFVLGGAETPDVDSNGLEALWSVATPRLTEFQLGAGASQVSRSGEKQTRFTGQTSFHRPFRHTDLVAGYRRSLSADTGTEAVSLSQNAYLGFSARVGKLTRLGIYGDGGTREAALSEDAGLDLSFAGVALRAELGLNPRFSLSGEASRRRQTDHITDQDTSVTGYFLGLVYKVF